MKHLALLGDEAPCLRLVAALQAVGFAVTLLPAPSRPSPERPSLELRTSSRPTSQRRADRQRTLPHLPYVPDLTLVSVSNRDQLEALAARARGLSVPWLLLCPEVAIEDGGGGAAVASAAGAVDALPVGSSPELVMRALDRALATRQRGEGWSRRRRPRRVDYCTGALIPLRSDELLKIIEGVVAQVSWDEEGEEGLVGLWGPGHWIPGHPQDACGLSLRAHCDAVVEIEAACAGEANLLLGLRDRVRSLEAWASVRTRQTLEQRLLGVLGLLAEQFGRWSEQGTVIELRVTHAQLASAIGSTRATVTRLLGDLRRRDLVHTAASDFGERYCLPHGALWNELERSPRAG
ncbi:MAG: Crp/Fnr family transcriptional regulator [Acidobacteriota bacterium]